MRLMPKYFILPSGRRPSTKVYVETWKLLKTMPPDEHVKGWEWYSIPVRQILADIRRGLHDRINKRGGLVIREVSESRLRKLCDKHIRCECRECGVELDRYYERNARFCGPECRRAYYY